MISFENPISITPQCYAFFREMILDITLCGFAFLRLIVYRVSKIFMMDSLSIYNRILEEVHMDYDYGVINIHLHTFVES